MLINIKEEISRSPNKYIINPKIIYKNVISLYPNITINYK